MLNHPLQDRFLIRLDIDEEHMLAFLQVLLEAAEVGVGHLNTEEATLPGAETEQHHGEKDKGYPAGGRCGPAHEIGGGQHQASQDQTNRRTDLAGMDHVLLHK